MRGSNLLDGRRTITLLFFDNLQIQAYISPQLLQGYLGRRFDAQTDWFSPSENQVIDAICKTDSEFAFPEFDFRRVTFVR